MKERKHNLFFKFMLGYSWFTMRHQLNVQQNDSSYTQTCIRSFPSSFPTQATAGCWIEVLSPAVGPCSSPILFCLFWTDCSQRVVALQCWVGFCRAAKWTNHVPTCTPSSGLHSHLGRHRALECGVAPVLSIWHAGGCRTSMKEYLLWRHSPGCLKGRMDACGNLTGEWEAVLAAWGEPHAHFPPPPSTPSPGDPSYRDSWAVADHVDRGVTVPPVVA